MIRYGTCNCGKWGLAPEGFKETKHFLKCTCGLNMYLLICNPEEAGYREKDKITITLEPFDKKLLQEFKEN